jgi:hypothetical protein
MAWCLLERLECKKRGLTFNFFFLVWICPQSALEKTSYFNLLGRWLQNKDIFIEITVMSEEIQFCQDLPRR